MPDEPAMDARPARRRALSALGRRSFLGVVGGGTATATLAGCVDDSSAPNTDEERPDVDDDEPDDESDVSLEGAITIGHLAPMDNPLGLGSKRSADLAAAELNADGGILDATVEVITVDSRTDPVTAQDEVETLVQEDDIDVLIGSFNSEVAQAVTAIVTELDVPFIITGSADPSLIEETVGSDYEQYRNVFRTGPLNRVFQAEAIADYCAHLEERHGWDRVALLRDQARWTHGFAERIPGLLEDRGLEIVHHDALSIEGIDFGPVMSDVADSGADFVLRFFAHIDGGEMLWQWHEGEYEFGIEGIHVSGTLPSYNGESAYDGAATYETTMQIGAGGVAPITEQTLPFVERYVNEYGTESTPPATAPMPMGFNTYDAIHFYAAAIETAGTVDFESDPDAIVDAMLGQEFTGTAGEISLFGRNESYPHELRPAYAGGEITNAPITQWQPDGLECVYPESIATADHVVPPWM